MEEKDFNIKCENLRLAVRDVINQSDLPLAAVYYIIKDIYSELFNLYMSYFNTAQLKKLNEQQEQLDQNIDKLNEEIKQ